MTTEPSVAQAGPPPAIAQSRPHPAAAATTTLLLYSLGHFTVDVYSAALGVFQPLFAQHLGVTLSQAGLLGGIMILASSVMQPLYGYLSDRFPTRLFSVLAPAVAGLFISSLSLASSFAWLLLLVVIGASAVASFHPQASVRAAAAIEGSRAKAMAFFISSGQLGFALGPLYFSLAIGWFGYEGTFWAALPGLLVTGALLVTIPDRCPAAARSPRGFSFAQLRPVWKPLSLLYALVFLRSVLQLSFTQFLPLYLTKERGFSLALASLALTLYSAGGALGGFAGGHLADRFGGRRVILYSMIGAVPFLALFFLLNGPAALVCLALGGLVLLATNPVNIVMAQQLAPAQSGTISALMMGFAWGMAGIVFIPLVGLAAEHFGLGAVLRVLLLFPVLGWLLALRLRHE